MDESSIHSNDSDYEDEESMEVSMAEQHETSKNRGIVDDSSVDEGDASEQSGSDESDELDESSLDVNNVLNASIGIAIRRSIHRFSKAVSQEDDSSNSEEPEIVEDSDSADAVQPSNRNRTKRNIISDDDSEEGTDLSTENSRHRIQDSESPEILQKKEKRSGPTYRRNRIISEDVSSDDEPLVKAGQSRHSIKGRVKSPAQEGERYSTAHKIDENTNESGSAESVSSDQAHSSRDESRNSIEEAESPRKKREFESAPDLDDDSEGVVEILDVPKKRDAVIEITSSSDEKDKNSSTSMENSIAISMAKEETLNTTIDPMMAQERALLVYKQQQIESKLAKQKMLYKTGNMVSLPDRGERLRQSILNDEKELATIAKKLQQLQSQQIHITPPKIETVKPAPMFKQDSRELDPTYLAPKLGDDDRELGKKAQATLNREQSLTVERLQDLHGSLLNRPTEDQKAEDPRGLKVPLMPHQQHALAWLLWREEQKPPGGVLADDMGLGKTLTMISLVVASIAKHEASGDSDGESEWKSSMRPQKHLGGTLVVAPASLLAQWEAEVNNRCKRGLISVELYHGNNRENVPRRLAKTNIVVTTYNILSREFKTSGVLYKIQWRRVILDEAHIIRNHKSQTCEAVCGIHANKRWALTGTPIHNKEMDLYSILKFLRCSPFDDVRVWKRWVDNKNNAGHERLAMVMKTLMLRRTKAELQAKGDLETMPNKNIEIIHVDLDQEERNVYDKVMVYSRTLFAQFLAQRAEKQHMFELGAGHYDKPSWQTNYKKTQFTKAQDQLLAQHADVKSHEILVLLLRLRQVCCHPPLIHKMLDQDDIETAALDDDGGSHTNLLNKMGNLSMKAETEENEGDIGVDKEVTQQLLTSDNPVFDAKRQCSKMRAVLAKTSEIIKTGDKLIIVSQWTGVLEVIAEMLDSVKGVTSRMFTGKVAVKDRQGVMDNFNSPKSKVNVLLLSLTAGGVGLNLVGANHLLLIDIHWNPQLESQAQDRIYRFGQTKDVFIYKYICTDTIEERIQALQEKKLELAAQVLQGGGHVIGTKLSLSDLKSLFSL